MRPSLRLVLLGVAAFLVALVIVLPASWMGRALPPTATCANWSGSVWRGQCTGLSWSPGAAKQPVKLDSMRWQLHPLSLLRLQLGADVELSGAGVQARATLLAGRNHLRVSALSGAGALDHQLLGALPAGWTAKLDARDVEFELLGRDVQRIAGTLTARELTAEHGTRLGDYELQFAPQQHAPFTGTLRDVGGPVELKAQLTIKADRSWMLDGAATLRPGSPPQLGRMLDQMNSADLQGRHRILLEGVVD